MAAQYIKRFNDLLFNAYGSAKFPLTSIAAGNQKIRFMPIQGSESLNINPQIQIQIYKRLKAYDSPEKPMEEPGKSANSVKGSKNLINRLDAAITLGWDSLETKWQNKRELLLRSKDNQHLDYSENSIGSKLLKDSIYARLMEHEEGFIDKIVGDLADGDVTEITTLDKTGVIDKIKTAIRKIKLLVDDFVAYSDDVVVILHPCMLEVYSDHQGMDYQQGTNTFGSGFENGFRYLNVDFFESTLLNAISKEINDSQGNKHKYVPAAIVISKQWIYDAGLDTAFEKLSQKFFNEGYEGHSYAELFGYINRDRIKIFKVNSSLIGVDPSKKVNE